MLQLMGLWVPVFKNCIDTELSLGAKFITFAFATVDQEGRPRVRTCVYRGFLFNNSKNNVLTFTTDKRMMKYQELENDCGFEACFYFAKSKKQFRFSGVAKIINNEIRPQIILPMDGSEEEVEGSLNGGPTRVTKEKLRDLLVYPLISPGVLDTYKKLASDSEHVDIAIAPPTSDEWDLEMKRHWETLSRSMKSSFRKPEPGSKITLEKRTLLDLISRRVDGDKDEVGLENFSVVCLFVNTVDCVDLDNLDNRRFISKRVHNDHWEEEEVCP